MVIPGVDKQLLVTNERKFHEFAVCCLHVATTIFAPKLLTLAERPRSSTAWLQSNRASLISIYERGVSVCHVLLASVQGTVRCSGLARRFKGPQGLGAAKSGALARPNCKNKIQNS